MTLIHSRPKRKNVRGKPSKNWYVRVYDDETGKTTWRSTGATTKQEAEKVKAKWLAGEEDTGPVSQPRGVTFKAAAEAWLKSKKPRSSAACMRVYRAQKNNWCGFFRGSLARVTRERVDEYFAKRKGEVSARTMENERLGLRSMFEYAIGEGWIRRRRNPMQRIAKFKGPTRTKRVLTEKQERRLLKEAKAAGGNTYLFTLTLICSGLRRGTVAALEWGDIDFEHGMWQIPGEKMKSDDPFEDRPIAPDLLAELRRQRRPSGLVVGLLDIDRFRAAAEGAGVAWLKPHDLRRGFVSRCRREGIPLEVCMYLSDHRDLQTVLDSYRVIEPKELCAAVEKLFPVKEA